MRMRLIFVDKVGGARRHHVLGGQNSLVDNVQGDNTCTCSFYDLCFFNAGSSTPNSVLICWNHYTYNYGLISSEDQGLSLQP